MARRRSIPQPTWETRLLLLVTLVLVVFGIAAVYGASSIVAVQSGEAGTAFAFRQLIGATIGGAGLLIASRVEYHMWRRLAWPMLGPRSIGMSWCSRRRRPISCQRTLPRARRFAQRSLRNKRRTLAVSARHVD